MKRVLLIQTAFIGDVILATGLLEKLHAYFPETQLDMVVRKGNESLLKRHPFLGQVYTFDKKQKYASMWALRKVLRPQQYDLAINVQRFASSGMISWLSGAKERIGFAKNPLSFTYDKKFPHEIGTGQHELERNQQLIAHLTDGEYARPKLYPSKADYAALPKAKSYVCLAPTSVWFTKQWPADKWVGLIQQFSEDTQVFLLGAPGDKEACTYIQQQAGRSQVTNLAGKLSLLQSAALMAGANMNYVNDSAPLHLASAMNAPLRAIFCSTVPAFGFTPVSDDSQVLETQLELACRPCGLHGHKACPEGHFKCTEVEVVTEFPK
ncbi:MAG: glycosyltransferase family 9 protein [Bacteroidota bacterium]